MVFLAPALLVAPAAQIALDRIAASVDGAPITQSDVEQEYKLETFLEDGRVPAGPPDAGTFTHVLDHLIDQRLLAQELKAEGFQDLEVSHSVADRLDQIRRKAATDDSFRAALESMGIDENQLRHKLEEQQRIVQMIDRRFRSSAEPTDSEIEGYYRTTFLPEFAKRGTGSPPDLSDVADQIGEILVEKKLGQLQEEWIKDLRSTHRVKILSDQKANLQ